MSNYLPFLNAKIRHAYLEETAGNWEYKLTLKYIILKPYYIVHIVCM